MLLVVATLVASLTAAAIPAPKTLPGQGLPKACTAEELSRAGYLPADLKRLDELPPAYQHLAVIRSVGGCAVATIRYGGQTYWQPIPPLLNGGVHPLDRSPLARR